MKKLTVSERKKLKSRAHHLKPVVQLGQKGLTQALTAAIDKALKDHELIKIKFMEFKDEKRIIADEIAEKTESSIIAMIGNVLILYRENEENDCPNFMLR